MAIVLLVSTNQVNEPYQYENDMISVFPDGHQFSDYELARFGFVTINGSVADVEAKLYQIKPQIGVALMGTDGNWTFDRSEPTTGEELEVWSYPGANPLRWFKYVVPFKYDFNLGQLTAEEKQLLESIDINHPSVDSAIRKIVKDLAVDPANNEVVQELQNQTFS